MNNFDSKIASFVSGRCIKSVDYSTENFIIISYENENKKLYLYAEADCCSISWFEIYNQPFISIIGKELKSIDMVDRIYMPESNRQECDKNTKMTMNFTDGDPFEFVLRNSSNGYYNGYLELSIR